MTYFIALTFVSFEHGSNSVNTSVKKRAVGQSQLFQVLTHTQWLQHVSSTSQIVTRQIKDSRTENSGNWSSKTSTYIRCLDSY